jgi:hypothetical protein
VEELIAGSDTRIEVFVPEGEREPNFRGVKPNRLLEVGRPQLRNRS